MESSHFTEWPPGEFDVLIAGAGIIGASIAWRLARTGARVLLADAGAFGGEASSAGAGMLAPGGEIDRPGRWAELAIASLKQYPDYVAGLRAETGLAIDFRPCGATKSPSTRMNWPLSDSGRKCAATSESGCDSPRRPCRLPACARPSRALFTILTTRWWTPLMLCERCAPHAWPGALLCGSTRRWWGSMSSAAASPFASGRAASPPPLPFLPPGHGPAPFR